MAGFTGDVVAIDRGYFEKRLVRELHESLIWIHGNRRGEMPIGFQSDGASVPCLWWLPGVYVVWGTKAHREAFWHDYCYRKDSEILTICDPIINAQTLGPIDPKYIVKREPIIKEDADWWFRITLRDHTHIEKNDKGEDVVVNTYSWGTYQPMYWAVRTMGDSSFHRMKVMDKFQVIQ